MTPGRARDDLQVHLVPTVLARAERPVGGYPVEGVKVPSMINDRDEKR